MLSKSFSILLIEDHPHYLNGLSNYLVKKFKSVKVTTTTNGKDALQKLNSILFDVSIIDISLPDVSGIEIVKYLSKRGLKTKVITNSYQYDINQLNLLIQNNVDGILLKGDDEDSMADTIIKVLNDEKHYSQSILPEIENISISHNNCTLTETEYYILSMICKGMTSDQISKERNVSINTVNTHKKRIFAKFKVHNAVELVTLAVNNGII